MYHKNDPRRNAKSVFSIRTISYGIIITVALVYGYVYYFILPSINDNKSISGASGSVKVSTENMNMLTGEVRQLIAEADKDDTSQPSKVAASSSTSSSSPDEPKTVTEDAGIIGVGGGGGGGGEFNMPVKKKGSELSDLSLFQSIEAVNAYYDKVLSPLNDVVTNWPPELPDARPADWVDVVPTFDWNDPEGRKAAQNVREAEKPFKLINVPQLATAKQKWTYDYLKRRLGNKKGQVEVSESKSFMYWKKQRSNQNGPTTYERMDWLTFLEEAKKLDESSTPDMKHFYWHTNARNDPWIDEDLEMFRKEKDNFFIVDPAEYDVPIACRIGTKGLCNENHYDTHRTFATQVFGSKRWVFQPPTECSKMYLYPDRHISARHSEVDINSGHIDLEKYPKVKTALAVDTVVHAGEMAYLPSNWFHHIISLEFNMQCVARSGHSLVGDDYIEECGFAGGMRSMGKKRPSLKKKLKT
jgi:hypothetical protein